MYFSEVTLFVLVVFALTASKQVDAIKRYLNLIPNGRAVPHPCNRDGRWEAVGHVQSNRGPARNRFGNDFSAANHQWTEALCQRDSDGDGLTNGQELGDPNCQWRPGFPTRGRARSHPGICEPVNSRKCRTLNSRYLSPSNCRAVIANNYNNRLPSWAGGFNNRPSRPQRPAQRPNNNYFSNYDGPFNNYGNNGFGGGRYNYYNG